MLAIQLRINAPNIGLDLWFVLGLAGAPRRSRGGDEGLPNGRALGWRCGCAGRAEPCHAGGLRRLLDRAQLPRMARVNGDIMLRSVLLQAAFTAFALRWARRRGM